MASVAKASWCVSFSCERLSVHKFSGVKGFCCHRFSWCKRFLVTKPCWYAQVSGVKAFCCKGL